MSFNRTLFDEFVSSLQLRFFKSGELLARQYTPSNGPPPITIWHNMVPTIMVLDELRALLDSPVNIICAYRTEAYNNNGNAGRSKRSQHMAYTAVDFKVPGKSVGDVGELLKSWNGKRWFGAAIDFERRPVTVGGGAIPFRVLPQRSAYNGWSSDHPYEFLFQGFVKVYSTFVHLDTRGWVEGEDGD